MMDEVKALRWNGILYMDQKVCLNLEKRPIACCCTHEQKINFEGFTQNGCYGNQSQPLEVFVDSTDANNPCPFKNQDLIFKKSRFDFQTSISCRFLFCSIQ